MITAPLDTPRSQRRPDLPIVFPFSDTIYFPDGGDFYGFTFEQFRDNFDQWLWHLADKRWWTPAHEHALRQILGTNESHWEGEAA